MEGSQNRGDEDPSSIASNSVPSSDSLVLFCLTVKVCQEM